MADSPMPTEIITAHPAQMAMLRASRVLSRAAGITYGPRAGAVLAVSGSDDCARFTRDALSLARSVAPEDTAARAAAELLLQAASETDARVGDGTALALLLACGIVEGGVKQIAGGADPRELVGEIRAAALSVMAVLRQGAASGTDARKLEQVAAGAAAGDVEMGRLVAEALWSVGGDGQVSVRACGGGVSRAQPESRCVIAGDLAIPAGGRPHDLRMDGALVLVLDGPLVDGPLLAQLCLVSHRAGRPVLVAARTVDPCALARWRWLRRLHPGPRAGFIGLSSFGRDARRALLDLSLATGAWIVSPSDARTSLVAPTWFGLGNVRSLSDDRSIEVTSPSRRHGAGAPDPHAGGRCARSASLNLGAGSEVEAAERATRARRALAAARAAFGGGVVTGGGVALFRSAAAVSRGCRTGGASILEEAAALPIVWLADNSGASGTAVLEAIRSTEGDSGFNPGTGRIEDLADAGVVEAYTSVAVALERASSVACLLLSAGSIIVNGGVSRPEAAAR